MPSTEEKKRPPLPDRRNTFRLLGVGLVWYYVYSIVKNLALGEVQDKERPLLIGVLVVLIGANLFLTIHLIKNYYQTRKAAEQEVLPAEEDREEVSAESNEEPF